MSGNAATRKELLRLKTKEFCNAFLNAKPPDKILSDFFVQLDPRITEHGPEWAQTRLPFLGSTFKGFEGCLEYFRLLGQVLEFQPSEDTFPPSEEFIVDDTARVSTESPGTEAFGLVSVVAKAHFKSIETGKIWHETFIYRLSDFNDEGKIGHWEIWADPLSAWEAVSGE
ncbi:MAG: hypothetical protein M1828_003353 [Chrysothrix sp. TS-e1954]|nr:MAG: hypothetical protein M1828_003353 [Chrysothrix sp. TS-e1954]